MDKNIKIVKITLGEIIYRESMPMLELKLELSEEKIYTNYLMPYEGCCMMICNNKESEDSMIRSQAIGLKNIEICTKAHEEKLNNLSETLGCWLPIYTDYNYGSGSVSKVLFKALIKESLLDYIYECRDRYNVLLEDRDSVAVIDFKQNNKLIKEFAEKVYEFIENTNKEA